jgi:peroxiredoxin
MRNSRWIYLIISTTVLLFGLAWIYNSRLGEQAAAQTTIAQPRKGFLAPNFTLQTLDGKTITLSQLQGHPVIVNLWASWCGPCQEEMPDLNTVYNEYKARGLEVLAVNLTLQDSADSAAQFANQRQLTFPVLLDTNGDVQQNYAVRALPSSYFIGSDGVIHDVIIGGPIPAAMFRSEIEDLLKGTP